MACSSLERTWITCGAYALVHAAELPAEYMLELENTAGATFGLACHGAQYGYTRVLTPLRDFNAGIDEAASLWGVDLHRFDSDSPDAVASYACRYQGDCFVLGPISMMGLWYLPMCSQYKWADHFIMIRNLNGNRFLIVDSEGVPALMIDARQLRSILQIQGIPEANGMLTIRRVAGKTAPAPRAQRLLFAWEKAGQNLYDAQLQDQGSYGILKCAEIVRTVPPALWNVSLQYSLGDLIQRKRMLQMLAGDIGMLPGKTVAPQFWTLLDCQIEIAGSVYGKIACGDCRGGAAELEGLAETEKMLMQRWEDWISDDRNQ